MQGLAVLDHIEKLLTRLATDKIEQFVGKAAEGQLDLMADLNRAQLMEGVNNEDQIITPAYKPSTIKAKKKRGQPYNKVTLFWDGNFHRALKARRKGGTFELFDTDKKDADLREKYGDEIEGLTPESMQKVSQAMAPSILEQSRSYLLS